MIEICDNYAQHCVQKIFLYICFENMVQVDFFYEFNKAILEPHKLNDSNCEFKFDVSEKTQEVVGKALFDKAKKIIDIYKNEKEQPPVEIKVVYDNKNTEISISDTAKFKSYMGLSYFYNQWLEEEKYKCALENGEIKSFETELNDIQSDMIDICNEYSLGLSDNIFIYINNGESFYSNHGYKIGGKCYKKENIAESGISDEFDVREYIFDQIEDIFENDFRKLDFLFKHFNRETPKQVFIDYDTQNSKLKIEFKYELSDNPEKIFLDFLNK